MSVQNGGRDGAHVNAHWLACHSGEGGALNNFTATTDPGVNDDSGDGYGVGSRWINVTNDREWSCLDATAGAAIWWLVNVPSVSSPTATFSSPMVGWRVYNTTRHTVQHCAHVEAGEGAVWQDVDSVPLYFGASGINTANDTRYMRTSQDNEATSDEYKLIVHRYGQVRDLRVKWGAAGGTVGTNVTFTVRKNGVDTTLVATQDVASVNEVTDADDGHAFSVIPGDEISIKVTKSGGLTSSPARICAEVSLVGAYGDYFGGA